MARFTPAYLGTYNPGPNSANATTANRAWFMAVTNYTTCTVTGLRFGVGATSGNVDVGLYSSSGTRLASSGSTACPAANTKATVSFSASVTIPPGVYLSSPPIS